MTKRSCERKVWASRASPARLSVNWEFTASPPDYLSNSSMLLAGFSSRNAAGMLFVNYHPALCGLGISHAQAQCKNDLTPRMHEGLGNPSRLCLLFRTLI